MPFTNHSFRRNGTWKEKPTPIAIPNQSRNSAATGPYTKQRLSSNLNGSRSAAGNPVSAKALQTELSHKRRRLDQDLFSTTKRGKRSTAPVDLLSGRSKARTGVCLAPDDHDLIYIDDDNGEDIGTNVPRGSSPDQLDVIHRDSAHPRSVREDGPSTSRLRIKHKERQLPGTAYGDIIDVDDPIEDYEIIDSNEMTRKAPARMPTPNKTLAPSITEVKKRFEERPPHLDLAIHSVRSVRKSMKGKDSKRLHTSPYFPPQDPLATDADFIHQPTAKSSTNAPPNHLYKLEHPLPIEKWALGTKMLPEKGGPEIPEYFLVYKESKSCLTIKCGALDTGSSHSESIRADTDIREVKYSDLARTVSMEGPTIQIKTISSSKNTSTSLGKYFEYFKLGSPGADGFITIKLNRSHDEWSDQDYVDLVKSLKDSVPSASTIDEHASKSIWTTVDQAADLKNQELSRRSTTREPQLYEPPTHIRAMGLDKIRKSAVTTVSHSLEGTPEPAKARPRPRPAYKGPGNAPNPSEQPRRSSRQSIASNPRRSPTPDPDELILVYPPSGTGAVNIMRSDLNRLQPGEFLNDTLIEFGLKLWLNDLREKDPEFANQIHVFSSFFYKKLNRKSLEEGYDSVRKWTSKFDIFQKKYIIVPINEHLHWYLAIIYQPEHVLAPPPFQEPQLSVSTRGRKRKSDEANAERHADTTLGPTEAPSMTSVLPSPSAQEDNIVDHTSNAMQEEEVENMLQIEETFDKSCSIGSDYGQPISPSKVETFVGPVPIDVDKEVSSYHELPYTRHVSPSVPDSDMEVDVPQQDGLPTALEATTPETALDEIEPVLSTEATSSTASPPGTEPQLAAVSDDLLDFSPVKKVPATKFYGSASHRTKRKLAPFPMNIDGQEQRVDTDESLDIPDTSTDLTERAWIFTLDSLGSRHPQVNKNLRAYLRMEAKDKKGIEQISTADAKHALVPVQPNYCDCGLYLLHFAKTFMKDPVRYQNIIATRKSNSTIVERQLDWEDSAIGGFRDELIARILTLSEVWKADRVAKEKAKEKEGVKKEETDDSDIDIVEDVQPVNEAAPKSPKRIGKGKGKAQRMRG